MKRILTISVAILLLFVLQSSCLKEEFSEERTTEPTTISTTLVTISIPSEFETKSEVESEIQPEPTAKSKEQVKPVTRKIQRTINGFELGMHVEDFKKEIQSRGLEIVTFSSESEDDGRFYLWGGPDYNYKIEGFSFFFDSTDTLYAILVWQENDVKGDYSLGNGDLFSSAVAIYGDDYERLNGIYVFFDGETYLELSLNRNDLFQNFVVDGWCISTRRQTEESE